MKPSLSSYPGGLIARQKWEAGGTSGSTGEAVPVCGPSLLFRLKSIVNLHGIEPRCPTPAAKMSSRSRRRAERPQSLKRKQAQHKAEDGKASHLFSPPSLHCCVENKGKVGGGRVKLWSFSSANVYHSQQHVKVLFVQESSHHFHTKPISWWESAQETRSSCKPSPGLDHTGAFVH